jgi:hypothetical protein
MFLQPGDFMRFLALFLALAVTCQSASAAVVTFLGTVQTATGGLMAVGQQFQLDVTYTPTFPAPTLGAVTSITFTNLGPGPALGGLGGASGGNLILAGAASPALDNLTVALSPVAFPGSSLVFQFSSDVGSIGVGAPANAVNVGLMVDGKQGDAPGFVFNFGGANGTYTGAIAGVPEPSSMAVIAGLVGFGAMRIRKRRLAKKKSEEVVA